MGTESGKEAGKEAGAPAAGADQGEGKSFDEIFDAAMEEPEGDGGAASAAGDGAGSGTGDGAGTEGTGDGTATPPEGGSGTQDQEGDGSSTGGAGEGTAAEGGAASGQAQGLTDEDKTFLRSIDLEGVEVTPKELTNLRKVHGKLSGIIETERRQKEFFGKSNEDLSGRYKTLKVAYREIMKQQTPADRVKGVISKIDQSKLSPEARELLSDPAYLEANSAILGVLIPTDKQGPGGISLDDDEPGAGEGGDAAAAGAGTPGAGAGAGELTQEQTKERVRGNIQTAAAALKDSHPDMLTIYQAPEFATYFKGMSTIEQMKVFSDDPRAHSEVLTGYKSYKAAKDAEAAASTASQQKKDSLRTHQAPSAPGPKGQPSDGPTPEQIMNDDAAYDAIEQRVRKATVRTG